LGLASRYKTDIDLQLHVKSHIALAFLPTADVVSFAQTLHTQFVSELDVVAFQHYFVATWLNGIFPTSLWNQYNLSPIHRTNNAVEGWHSRFNRAARVAHPNIFVLITHLQRENCNTHARVNQAKLGYETKVTRSKYDRLHARIQQLYDRHLSGDITSAQLLEQARHVLHVFE